MLIGRTLFMLGNKLIIRLERIAAKSKLIFSFFFTEKYVFTLKVI